MARAGGAEREGRQEGLAALLRDTISIGLAGGRVPAIVAAATVFCTIAAWLADPAARAAGGVASPEAYEVFLAPPGATVGAYEPKLAFQTSGGRSGLAVLPVGPTDPIVLDAAASGPVNPQTRLVITTSAVVAVSVDGGAALATRAVSGLPDELRSALIEVPSAPNPVRSRLDRISISAIEANGAPATAPSSLASLKNPALETRTWEAPARPSKGVCSVSMTRSPWITESSGAVVSLLRPLVGALGRPYLTCAESTFDYRGQGTLSAYVTIDAARPGRTPEGMPLMTPVAGQPGVYQSRIAEGFVVGRRVRSGWLLVEGGENAAQRLGLLGLLKASVRLGAASCGSTRPGRSRSAGS